MPTPPTADTSRSPAISAPRPAPPSTPFRTPTRSLSIRTSMACSPTAAAASSSAIPAVGRFYKHDSPFTYFTSKDLHLGQISLECSRAGASAVALWATQRLLPYHPAASSPVASRLDAKRRWPCATGSPRTARFVLPVAPPALDILFWAPRGGTAGGVVRPLAGHLRRSPPPRPLSRAGHAAGTVLSPGHLARFLRRRRSVTCLRSVMMKPEHLFGSTRSGDVSTRRPVPWWAPESGWPGSASGLCSRG